MKIEEYIDTLDPSKPLDSQQIEEADQNSEIRDTLEDLELITDSINEEKLDWDKQKIDRILDSFNKRHLGILQERGKEQKRENILRFVKIGLGIAAAIALVFMLSKPLSTDGVTSINVCENGIVANNSEHKGMSISAKADKNEVIEQVLDAQQIAQLIPADDTIHLNVTKGNSCKAILPDGSCAYLHPGSSLKYPHQFVGQERRVELKGEAYFIIQKDKAHPFIVEANNSETMVTGTQFNVDASHRESVNVTLVNGSVLFGNKYDSKRVALAPGHQASLSISNHIHVCEADTMEYVAWRDGYFYFDDAKLGDILQQIGQSYDVKVSCSNDKLLQLRMHLILERNKDLHQVIETLNKMKKVKARLEQKKLYIEGI